MFNMVDDMRDLGLGVAFDEGPPFQLIVTDLAKFRAALGDDLLVAFCRGFSLLYRIASVVDLMGINHQATPNEPIRDVRKKNGHRLEGERRQRRTLSSRLFTPHHCGWAVQPVG
jgi:hypothetical protein